MMSGSANHAKASAYPGLCGWRIVLFNTMAAAAAFMLAADEIDGRLMVLALGVSALACGARGLNQYQERRTDALMPRTCDRPICSGRMRPSDALIFSGCCISFGIFALLLTGSLTPPLLGAAAVAWYNGLYTNLKRYTPFAVVPGAIVGALPPTIGWAAAGGQLADPRLWHICFFIFMWQVPHSWAFMLRYSDEYEAAGLPSLASSLGPVRAGRVVFVWIGAAAVSSLLMITGGVVGNPWLRIAMISGSVLITLCGLGLTARHDDELYISVFRRMNVYAAVVLLILFLDNIKSF